MVKNRSYFSLALALLLSLVLASAALAHPIAPGSPYAVDHSIGQFQDDGSTDDGTGDNSGDDGTDNSGSVDNTGTMTGTTTTTATLGTDTTTDDTINAPAVTDPQQGTQDTQQGTQQQAPGTLPQTGGESTPWAMLLLIVVGGLVLFSGLGLAFSRRPH